MPVEESVQGLVPSVWCPWGLDSGYHAGQMMPRLLAVVTMLCAMASSVLAQGEELVIRRFAPTVDADLADWKSFEVKSFGREQAFLGASVWVGAKDASATFLVSCDNNRLYLAGTVRDDQNVGGDVLAQEQVDCLELHIGNSGLDAGARADRNVLRLFPLQAHRPWAWGGGDRTAAAGQPQPVTQLAGITVVAKRIDPTSYTFEAAIPFHHFPGLVPGTRSFGFDLVPVSYTHLTLPTSDLV